MGRFTYGSAIRIDFNDRLLAHLQQAIYSRLQRPGGFFFTWREGEEIGGARKSVWIHQQSELTFTIAGAGPLLLNRSWIEALSVNANSAAGLYVVGEPVEGVTQTDRVAARV